MFGLKNILLFLSLLVCSVNSERGVVQRGLAVGDRPTDAPETQPPKTPSPSHEGDDDDDSGKGKGKGKGMDVPGDDDDDDNSGKGKGKGKGVDVPGDDDDDDDSGKGSEVPSDDYYLSYPPSKGKGKGKSTKAESESKKSKSDKKSGMFLVSFQSTIHLASIGKSCENSHCVVCEI
jgi:hypothetical protein